MITNQLWIFGLRVLPATLSLIHLVRSISFCATSHQFSVLASHIRVSDNSIADALSHFQMLRFRQLALQAASPSTDPLAGSLAFQQSRAIAPSTCCTYSAGICQYATFSHSRQRNPFPASELQLRYFASWLSNQVNFPTIKLYLSGIWFSHIENSLADPFADAPLLHILLRGLKQTIGLSDHNRLPFTMAVMHQLKGAFADNPQIASQDKLIHPCRTAAILDMMYVLWA